MIMTEENMLCVIRCFISKNGKLVNKAQSAWGMDRWTLNGLSAGLCDEGYTDVVVWGDRLNCTCTQGRKIKYSKGDAATLEILYKGISQGKSNVY